MYYMTRKSSVVTMAILLINIITAPYLTQKMVNSSLMEVSNTLSVKAFYYDILR